MKKFLNPKILPWFTVGAGGLGLVLQLWFRSGIDEKGLLPAAHPALPLTYILLALVLGAVFFCARQLSPVAKYSRLFPAGIGRAVGCAVAAAGVLYAGLYFLKRSGGLGILTFAVALAAAAAMAFLAFLRRKGSRPNMVLHALLTVFFMLFTVCNCRIWGSEPQVQDYVFPLFACVFLMLTGYQNTVLDVQKAGRIGLVFCNQAALFFCCLALAGSNRFFYLTMIVYLALDLCSVHRGRQPEEA